MPRHDPLVRIRHMLDHAREAVDLAATRSRADLGTDRLLELALTRLVEIIGEAAAQTPPEVRAEYPSVPWGKIVGMRNRLVHGYDEVDLNVLWDAVTLNIPALIADLEQAVVTQADGAAS
jgi:uncharacterized protein with HEPN domain